MPSELNLIGPAFSQHPLYPAFIQVKNKLKQQGHVCWVVGGAVRDFLLNRIPFDFDLVTDATTTQILQIFPEALTFGAHFGVVKLPVIESTQAFLQPAQEVNPTQVFFDLATFRRESDYVDGRRPSQIDFATPEEDALRRDFTLNALYWNDENQILMDYVAGISDLKARVIRCVGVPAVRFQEDHLRILRLLRFATQFNLKIDPATQAAATQQVKSLERISGERIWAELSKLASSIRWALFLNEPFARVLFESLFPMNLPMEFPESLEAEFKRIDLVPGRGLQKLFYVLIKLCRSEELLIKFLKMRLKVSKKEILQLQALRFILSQVEPLSVFEWVYELENNSELVQAFYFLQFTGKICQTRGILDSFNSKPEKVISGTDLQGWISPVQMGDALKKIRLIQLAQPNLSKDQILEAFNQNKIISTKHKT